MLYNLQEVGELVWNGIWGLACALFVAICISCWSNCCVVGSIDRLEVTMGLAFDELESKIRAHRGHLSPRYCPLPGHAGGADCPRGQAAPAAVSPRPDAVPHRRPDIDPPSYNIAVSRIP
jgi:hypothetical protein